MSERQMATTLDEVRADHLARYQFAIEELKRRGRTKSIIDAGCGVGYGSALLAGAVGRVTSLEIDADACAIYRNHWQRDNIDFRQIDVLQYQCMERVDAVVCFEFIEHIDFSEAAIERFAQWSDLLIVSSPNEEVRPHRQEPVNPFHFRHFRPRELQDMVERHGFAVERWYCQKSGGVPEIREGTNGKFMIAVCQRRRVE
jgi:2-polyprenyl-3-methyl-5-hydroxy-6-metoxy-1,4-benzoquinol methylase